MIEVEVTDSGVRAVDAAKTSVAVRAADWSPDANPLPLSVDADATVAGYATELRLPPSFVRVERADGDHVTTLGNDTGPVDLPAGAYLLHVETNVRTELRFDGAATVEKPGHEETVVRFPRETPVTLGFASRLETPPETVTVPPTPSGIAAGLSAMPAAHRTATPDRSFPTLRGHPPLLELGESLSVPDAVAERRPATDVTVTLPPSREKLFPAAPLSFYLGADVEVAEGATPTVEAPGVRHTLPGGEGFDRAVAALLRRVFLLDSLVRTAGPHGVAVEEGRHLSTLGLDAGDLYEASIPERLSAYLDADFERVSASLPEWHLAVAVAPTDGHVASLPHHLHRLAAVVTPEADPLDREERLSRSLEDFYRGGAGSRGAGHARSDGGSRGLSEIEATRSADWRGPRAAEDPVTVEMLKPKAMPASARGWLAEGAPIDAYKALPAAYEHRLDYRDRAGEPFSFVAVLNDTGMAAEHARAAEIYRERADELDIDITVREGLGREALADVFASRNDLVHYIGHCEQGGLRCPDGHFSAADLAESNAQVFFLNACGSYYEGLDLVRKGSIAGAVTFNRVLDEQAARVGTTFARLLVGGFSIERALRVSRRRIMMGKDYTVVGDGTHVLTQATGLLPLWAELDAHEDGDFRLCLHASLPYINGGHFQPNLPGHDRWHLFGSDPELTVSRAELLGLLDHADLPVVFEGDIYWPDGLRDALE